MKKLWYLMVLMGAFILGCASPASVVTPVPTVTPTPSATPAPSATPKPNTTPVPQVLPATPTPYLNILVKTLVNVTTGMDYSLNNGTSWQACTASGTMAVTLAVGNHVLVRSHGSSATPWDLGVVNALTGLPQIFPNGPVQVMDANWNTYSGSAPGISYYIGVNLGDLGAPATGLTVPVTYYISPTRDFADPAARMLVSDTYTSVGVPMASAHYYPSQFQVPNLAPGTYYVGCVVDPNGTLTQLGTGNRMTRPENAAVLVIEDPMATTQGAFKVMNSWGTNWAHITGNGHYWITYASLKALKLAVFYFNKNYSSTYNPTVQAVFHLSGGAPRNSVQVTFGVGSPTAPLMTKQFMPNWFGTSLLGTQPLPNQDMVFDISEFAPYINTNNVFMTVSDTGTTPVTVTSASVNYYSAGGGSVQSPLASENTSSTLPLAVPTSATLTIPTIGTVSLGYNITPLPRAVNGGALALKETKPTSAELAADQLRAGISFPGQVAPPSPPGQHGKGYLAPTAAEWSMFNKLRSVQTGSSVALVNTVVDHTKDVWFPPVADQGNQGACTCFATVYYSSTYSLARTNGWNLSSVTWVNDQWAAGTGTSGGSPSGQLDNILSPAFCYNMINRGADKGSSITTALGLLQYMGVSSWNTMPWSDSDYTTFPGTAALKEAGTFRVGDNTSDLNMNYFLIQSDADINMLKALLASGYCVVTAIVADADLKKPDGLYYYLDSHDVISTTNFDSTTLGNINHAQTIVGFKDGTTWNPSNPDQ